MGFWDSFGSQAGTSGAMFIDNAVNQVVGSKAGPWLTKGNQGVDYADQINDQERFAKSGIQWKVADARAAGIHPLAALGAQSNMPAAVPVGSNFPNMGQNVSNALARSQTEAQREMDRLDISIKDEQRKGLEWDNLLKQRNYENPPVPNTGIQTDAFGSTAPKGMASQSTPSTQGWREKEAEQTAKASTGVAAGRPAAFQHFEMRDGSLFPTISPEGEEKFTEDAWSQVKWFINNAVTEGGPTIEWFFGNAGENHPVWDELKTFRPVHGDPDKEFRWNPKTGMWQPFPREGKFLAVGDSPFFNSDIEKRASEIRKSITEWPGKQLDKVKRKIKEFDNKYQNYKNQGRYRDSGGGGSW